MLAGEHGQVRGVPLCVVSHLQKGRKIEEGEDALVYTFIKVRTQRDPVPQFPNTTVLLMILQSTLS